MSKQPKGDPLKLSVAGGSKSSSKRKSNVSLPEKATPPEVVPSGSRRNTITEENTSKPRKKTKVPSTPTIPEDVSTDEVQQENRTAFVITNETNKKLNRNASDASRVSSASGKSAKVAHTYENKAFEGHPKVNETRNDSIRTTSRAPSLQSLEIYREQYCCFAKRTKCERGLLVAVIILIIIVIVLVIVIIVVARHQELQTVFSLPIG